MSVSARAPSPQLGSRRSGVSPLAITGSAAASLAVIAGTAASEGTGLEGWQLINRYLARLSFVLFLLPFSASALRSLWPRVEAFGTLLRHRRAAGLAFATAHGIHAAAIFALASVGGEPFDPSAAVGGMGFVFTGLLAATSNDAAVRWLGGRRWKRLHRTGIWVLWAIFTLSYLGRVVEGRHFFVPFLTACAGVAALRFLAHRKRRAGATA